jgi:hypothetical protein
MNIKAVWYADWIVMHLENMQDYIYFSGVRLRPLVHYMVEAWESVSILLSI